MKVYIRVDASFEIGTGHVMRCLTLADKLREQGAVVCFICREHPGHLCGLIEHIGYQVLKLPAPQMNQQIAKAPLHYHWLGVPISVDAAQTKELLKGKVIDLLIIDHYSLNIDWELRLRENVNKIMVIDDLADRKHDCDYLLDQNYLEHYQYRYLSLVPLHCKTFLGPSYVLIRSEFYKQAKRFRSGAVRRIFLFFGGIDQTNETGKALAAFLELGRQDIEIDVVVGHSNPFKKELASLCQLHDHLHFHCQVNNMAELMSYADLSIGAGGTTTWERLYLGLPSIVISIAPNQEKICEGLAKEKVIKYLGKKETVKQSFLTLQLKKLIENEGERLEMARLANLLFKDAKFNQQTMIKQILE
ncbi:UDP-2,4-diacetamido-2,4,6-trideoxy-beta-L-altropyranose hydrolase [Bacillaceae bacterium C204]|uniref:UDP-2,4-diacetamido-2,4, 6-trideoxy-beta-L-altropyranose hydrolase n=1 Tax=Neobacillus sp. 204 TaxID=3383351 RepID=UPI00397D16AD